MDKWLADNSKCFRPFCLLQTKSFGYLIFCRTNAGDPAHKSLRNMRRRMNNRIPSFELNDALVVWNWPSHLLLDWLGRHKACPYNFFHHVPMFRAGAVPRPYGSPPPLDAKSMKTFIFN